MIPDAVGKVRFIRDAGAICEGETSVPLVLEFQFEGALGMTGGDD